MKQDLWLNRGLEELKQEHWFDGFQMLQGALERTVRCNKPGHAEKIISKATPLFTSKEKEKYAIDLILGLILNIRRRLDARDFVELIPFSFGNLRKSSLENCVFTICNQILIEKAFQNSEFLSHLHDIIIEANFDEIVLSDLYFCYAGLLCYKKDFVLCFETLHSWSKKFSSLSPKMRTYLTLAEINAYEIEDCGKFLFLEDRNDTNEISSDFYLEIANRIFGAVKTLDKSEFHSTISDYSDLINSKKDGLLKALCDGISEIFNNKSGSGILSMFKQ